MNGIQNQQNSISFQALIPKYKYSGTPKLSKQCITQINRLKTTIKLTDKEILELENQLSNPNIFGKVASYLKNKLAMLNKFKSALTCQINCIKHYNEFDARDLYRAYKEKYEFMEKLEKCFEQGII